MGVGGSLGFVGRAFGGIAARNGATLTSDSISSVASRPSAVSGSIGGEIADRSLSNYMPQFSGHKLADTQISGGHISTKTIGSDGKETAVELFHTAQFEKPDVPHAIVTASDGSQWYQMASGPAAGSFYDVPHFSGSGSEASQIAATFPDAPDGTVLRTVDQGAIEASSFEAGSPLPYSNSYQNVLPGFSCRNSTGRCRTGIDRGKSFRNQRFCVLRQRFRRRADRIANAHFFSGCSRRGNAGCIRKRRIRRRFLRWRQYYVV